MSKLEEFTKDKIESLESIKDKFGPIKNPNVIHRNKLSINDRIALFITNKVGTMGFFYFCFVLVSIPLLISSTLPVIQYISSGYLQLILLPLIIVGQNLQGRHTEIRAEHDFDTNVKAEKEVEAILLHLEKQDAMMLDILHRIEVMEKTREII